ncbi:hypothetical protein KEM56_003115 [Ascosphaera pollenicola]|nr:hypothetical protein KEM56_003115 [Ascosphaera pollenicola]
MDSPAACSGPVVAEDNIINRRGGESLYQTCANLKRRLAEVPGFEPFLAEIDLPNEEGENDPVASVWQCLRSGYPLVTIYNASNPPEPIVLDDGNVPENKRPKLAAFKFVQAVLSDFRCPQQDCFLLTDLYSESTTGFVKVIKIINRILDMLEAEGRLYKSFPSQSNQVKEAGQVKLTRRQHILKEMIETERDYVLHMENLQALRKELDQCGSISGDTIHLIFLNLHNLLDFAQKFLIGMEQHYARAEEKQNWGELFLSHKEGFQDYEPFIANQTTCDSLCTKEWNKIVAAPKSADLQQMVAQLSTLNGFFVKPFQRLTKYPLMLKELQKTTEQENLKADIQAAIDMIQDVLDEANHAIDKENLSAAVTDLSTRIEDWKALKPETFGDLVRYGSFHCIREGSKDNDRENEFENWREEMEKPRNEKRDDIDVCGN